MPSTVTASSRSGRAIACFARERGIPIEVESEYLPKALLKFSWAGEIAM